MGHRWLSSSRKPHLPGQSGCGRLVFVAARRPVSSARKKQGDLSDEQQLDHEYRVALELECLL